MSSKYNHLIEKAKQAKNFAYVPYSNFKVGAAILLKNGEIYQGCNIENISFTPTVCAERTAFFKAISDGKLEFEAMAVVTDDDQISTPCGVCRQVMAEFVSTDFPVILSNGKNEVLELTFADLFPLPFSSNRLG